MRALFLLVIATLFLFCSEDTNAAQKTKKAKVITIDYTLVTDSTCTFLTDYCNQYPSKKSEIFKNRLISFTASRQQVERDSILRYIYNNITQELSDDNKAKAFALIECYEALTHNNDELLGGLYYIRAKSAGEKEDTITLKTNIIKLSDFAEQTELDYDQELSELNNRLLQIRNYVPLEKDLQGYWILDQFRDDHIYSYKDPFKGFSNNSIVYQHNTLHFTPTNSALYLKQSCMPILQKESFFPSTEGPLPPRDLQLFNKSNSLYISWAHQDISRNNTIFSESGRRSIQKLHASVSAELTRPKHSFGDKLAGEVTMTILDEVGNSIFDALSVSTSTKWETEMNLIRKTPRHLFGNLRYGEISVSSKNMSAKIKANEVNVDYYKWEETDSIYFFDGSFNVIAPRKLTKSEKEHLYSSNSEIKHLHSFKKYNSWCIATGAVGGGAAGLALGFWLCEALNPSEEDMGGLKIPSEVYIISGVVSVISITTSLILYQKVKHGSKLIQQYNQDNMQKLKNKATATPYFQVNTAPSGLAISYNF